mmetsp:Transcript_3482/g.5820  ORF Transcript_3482/g.5820 Transcript_3482/m.5820 type:complete len:143 (+) Transcript_3482:109-537(+)
MRREVDWRNEFSSLNILLSYHVWRQDHNSLTHPGSIGHIAAKNPDIARIYLRTVSFQSCTTAQHKNNINMITAGKHHLPQWRTVERNDQCVAPDSVVSKEAGICIKQESTSGNGRPMTRVLDPISSGHLQEMFQLLKHAAQL